MKYVFSRRRGAGRAGAHAGQRHAGHRRLPHDQEDAHELALMRLANQVTLTAYEAGCTTRCTPA